MSRSMKFIMIEIEWLVCLLAFFGFVLWAIISLKEHSLQGIIFPLQIFNEACQFLHAGYFYKEYPCIEGRCGSTSFIIAINVFFYLFLQHWLDPLKPVYRQLKSKFTKVKVRKGHPLSVHADVHPMVLCFRCKFYPTEPSKLKEEITRSVVGEAILREFRFLVASLWKFAFISDQGPILETKFRWHVGRQPTEALTSVFSTKYKKFKSAKSGRCQKCWSVTSAEILKFQPQDLRYHRNHVNNNSVFDSNRQCALNQPPSSSTRIILC